MINTSFMKKALLLCLCSGLLWHPSALAADVVDEVKVERIPALASIPDSLKSEAKATFTQQKQGLQSQMAALKSASAAYSAKSAEQQTDGELNTIEGMKKAYITAANAFNQALAVEIAAEAQQNANPTPNPTVDSTLFVSYGSDELAGDISKDPALAASSRQLLAQINDRLNRLQKAIDILGNSNPEWTKEWETLHQEQIKATDQLMENGLELLTLGLAEGAKGVTEAQLEKAREAFQGQDFSELMRQRDSLLKIRKTVGDLPALDKWINELNRVEAAAGRRDTAEAIADMRELVIARKEAHEEMKKAGDSNDDMEKLYHNSAALGGVAVALVGGVGAKVAMPVAAAFKLTEAGLSVKLICEENRQFDQLAAQSVDRSKKKLELMKTRDDLKDQAQRLDNVIQRSDGLKPKP